MKYLLLMLLPLASHAAGGSTAGNGGDIVVCPNVPGQPEYRLLDFYEMDFYDKKTPLLPAEPAAPEEKVRLVIQDIARQSPLRGEAYIDELNHFWERATIKNEVPEIKDSRHLMLPTGCHVEQVMVQKRADNVPSYEVNGPLWNKLSPVEKAGTILHEIIYGEAIELGRENSTGTRAFLRYLLRDNTWKEKRDGIYEIARDTKVNRWMESVLDSGEVLLAIPDRGRCGVRLLTGRWIIRCGRFGPHISVNTDEMKRVISVMETDGGGLLYALDGNVVGLPYPLFDYNHGYNRALFTGFTPAEDIFYQDPWLKVWCEGLHEVDLARAQDAVEGRFDLTKSFLNNCERSKTHGWPQILLQGEWREFTGWSYHLGRSVGGYISTDLQFVKPEEFTVLGQTLLAGSIMHRDGWRFLEEPEGKPFPKNFRVLGQSCDISKKINLGISEEDDKTQWTYLHFYTGGYCSLKVNGAQMPVGNLKIRPDGTVLSVAPAKKTKLKIYQKHDDGKSTIELEEVDEYQTIYPYKPGVFSWWENP